nr:lactosylceramide 4-alpha-galactosyltransferase-like [Daphnia magna]
MNFRRTRPQQLIAIGSVTIIICVYSVTWPSGILNQKEDQDASPATLSAVQEHLNIVRYADMVRWGRNNQTSSSFWASSILSDDRRIYFHETTGRDRLNLRQLCAVESTAKENPSRSVQIFFQTDHVNVTSAPFELVLKTYPNIAVLLINAKDYFTATPLERWYSRGVWRKSPYKTEHFSDYIRILSSFKGGGMYMDLDFVTLKPLDADIFRNFVPEEDNAVLTGSSFHFQKGHPIVRKIMTYLASSYRPKEWAHSGPAMMQSVVLKYCRKKLPEPTYPLFLCPEIKVLPKKYLYPYTFADWKRLFVTNVSSSDPIFESYAVHTYNKLSKNEPVLVGSDQLYSQIARVHCPVTYAHALTDLEVDFF